MESRTKPRTRATLLSRMAQIAKTSPVAAAA